MTPEQISEAMWNLPLIDAVKVSISTDWIVFIRLWPLWVVISMIGLGVCLDMAVNKRNQERGW